MQHNDGIHEVEHLEDFLIAALTHVVQAKMRISYEHRYGQICSANSLICSLVPQMNEFLLKYSAHLNEDLISDGYLESMGIDRERNRKLFALCD